MLFMLLCHRGQTDDWAMMSRPKYALNDNFVCYQDCSEYVGLLEQGLHGQPALKMH